MGTVQFQSTAAQMYSVLPTSEYRCPFKSGTKAFPKEKKFQIQCLDIFARI